MSRMLGIRSPERGAAASPRLAGVRGVIGVVGAEGIAMLLPRWAGTTKPDAAEQVAMATIAFTAWELLICVFYRYYYTML